MCQDIVCITGLLIHCVWATTEYNAKNGRLQAPLATNGWKEWAATDAFGLQGVKNMHVISFRTRCMHMMNRFRPSKRLAILIQDITFKS